MLADKLVQIIRLRNMGESIQRSAEKWTQSLNTVDWLTAQLPVASKYQVITFNTEARAALPGTDGKWLEVADQAQLANVGGALRKIIPSGGTSLENAFLALRKLSPPPDNIFLITDGLPTQGTTPPRGSKVSGAGAPEIVRAGHPAATGQGPGEHHPGAHGGRPHGGGGVLAAGPVSPGVPC